MDGDKSVEIARLPSQLVVDEWEDRVKGVALKAKQSLFRKGVRGDGNCLFRSLGYQLRCEDDYLHIRIAFVAEVAVRIQMSISHFSKNL